MSVESASKTPCAFDHLVIGAMSLDEGAAWMRETLHREAPIGGRHPHMGTINRLAQLSQGRPLESGYLEIIAIDPEAEPPARPRWYGLDDPTVQARLAKRPRPVCWVLSTTNIEDAAMRAATAGWDIGEILSVSRGDLNWRIAVPRDGLTVEGVLPAVIEWPAEMDHRPPVGQMAAIGLALRELRLYAAAPVEIAEKLTALDGFEAAARAGVHIEIRSCGEKPPYLEAVFGDAHVRLAL